MSDFLSPNGLNHFFKSIKALFASKQPVKDLNTLFQVVEINGNLMAVCDKESNILCLIDANGVVQHPLGTKTSKITVDGETHLNTTYIGDCKIVETDDSGIFYILDSDDHVLFIVNSDGTVDFNGIPTDVQTKIDDIETRLTALESK